jgi:hypothetical protein
MKKGERFDFTKPPRREWRFAALVSGIETQFPPDETIKVDGTVFTQPEFLATAQGFLAPTVDSRLGHIALQKLIGARDANATPADRFYQKAREALIQFVGSKNVDALAAYGIRPPRKPSRRKAAEP